MDTFQGDTRRLRAAIAKALQLADAQNSYLVAAILSHALDAASFGDPDILSGKQI